MGSADVSGATLTIRPATRDDIPTLEPLIAASARALGHGFYSEAETEAAIAHVFGVDSELIDDGSYLVVEREGAILACGGWSRRRTLFGGDRAATRDAGAIDPATEPARIRAFFVAPHAARHGLGGMLLAACERAALAHGFTRMTLVATLPGQPFYARHGYQAEPAICLDLGGTAVRFVPMTKNGIGAPHPGPGTTQPMASTAATDTIASTGHPKGPAHRPVASARPSRGEVA